MPCSGPRRSPPHPRSTGPPASPVVDDLSLTAAVTVVVQNDVTVPAVELPVRRGVHGHFVGAFDSPDLPGQGQVQTRCGGPRHPLNQASGETAVQWVRVTQQDELFIRGFTWAQAGPKEFAPITEPLGLKPWILI